MKAPTISQSVTAHQYFLRAFFLCPNKKILRGFLLDSIEWNSQCEYMHLQGKRCDLLAGQTYLIYQWMHRFD
jgi:hypothetical protein